MSRAAQTVAAAVKQMNVKPRPFAARRSRRMDEDGVVDDVQIEPVEPPYDAVAGPDTPAEDAGGSDIMETQEVTATKKKGKKKSATKTAKPRAPRAKVAKAAKLVPDGAITAVEKSGETYLRLTFESGGTMMLTPTSNRVPNRDAAVKSLRALIK